MKRIPVDIVKYNQIVESFHSESDRGAAILAGGFMHEFCKSYIRFFMVEDPFVEKLFEPYAPLNTFAACSDCLYAFGLIDKGDHLDLKFVRQIRNQFAHHLDDLSFDASPIKELCSKLSTGKLSNDDGPIKPKFQYLFAIGLLMGSMHDRMLQRVNNQQSAK